MKLVNFQLRLFNSGKWSQYFAGGIGSLSLALCAANYVWLNPLIGRLTSPLSPIPLSVQELSWAACMPELACLFSTIPSGYLTDIIGRRFFLLSTVPLQVILWVSLFFTHHAYILIVIRLFQGFLVGGVCTVLPLYLVEIADKDTRGRLGVMSSLGWNFGCLLEYCFGPFTSIYAGLWINLAFPIVFFVLFYGFQESPYFLLMRQRNQEARTALQSFRDIGSPYEKEMEEMEESIANEKKVKASWKDLLFTPAGRRGLIVISVINITFNMSGAMSVLVFCTNTFQLMIQQPLSPNLFTIGMGVALTIVPIVTALFIDRYGRRPTLLISFGGSTLCLIPATVFFFLKEVGHYDVRSWAVFPIVGIALYPTMINFGAMIVAHTYQGELFMSSTRGLSSAWGTLLGGVVAAVTIQVYQPFEHHNLDRYTYLVYTLFALTGFLYCMKYAPETKGKTFDEIQQILVSKTASSSQ